MSPVFAFLLPSALHPREERDRASGYRKRGPKPKRLLLQRLYSMDLRSSHKAKGKEKLCFSLTCPLGSGSPEGVVKAGAPELVDKGPLVPALPFPLRKPRKAHKYLRLSRKKFPPRGPDLESHSHPRELFLQEPAAPDVLQAASEWEPAEQPPEEEGKVAPRPRPEPLRAGEVPGVGRSSCCHAQRGPRALPRPPSLWGAGTALALPVTLLRWSQAGKTNAVTSSWGSSLEPGPELGGQGSACRPHFLLPPSQGCDQGRPQRHLSPVPAADGDLAEGPPPWTPVLPPSEVTVTDITANSVTVTFREAQAAEGFFRDRGGKF